jgi:hypothetical protein
MSAVVCSGSMSYIRRKYGYMFNSPRWKAIRVKDWSDGKYTYVFEYVGQDN